jgi:hypothetical protein
MIRANLGNQIKKTLRLGLFGFAACSVTVPLFAEPNTVTLPPLGTNEQQVQKTAELIRKKLVTLPNYGVFDDLSFIINGSEVTMSGYASRPTLKTDAARAVRSVEGVESVVNKIEVLPLSNFDDQIRLRTYLAIYRNPNLRRYSTGGPLLMPRMTPLWAAGGITQNPPAGWNPIHIIVKNGNVTLTGVVDRDMDKQIIGMAVNRVPGVFSVNNDLTVVQPNAPKVAALPKAS